ncbi:MAG: multidrug efflux system membrane fusion protein [Gammaproteobacteria bacterium]|jgi:multidrug efflux system membrane fusion protein
MKLAGVSIAALLGVVVIAWVATGPGLVLRAPVEAIPTVLPPAPLTVQVATSKASPYRARVILRGVTAPSRVVALRTQIGGRIVALPVSKGNAVGDGETIARVDPAERAAMLREAQASVAQTRLEYGAADKLREQGYRAAAALAAARSAMEGALAARDRIRRAIANATITAPFAGVLNERHAEVGGYIMPGDVVGVVADLDPIVVVGRVSGRERRRISPGNAATVRLVDGTTWVGTVRYVSSVADPQTRTFALEVAVANPGNVVVAGLAGEIDIPAEETPAHLVPSSVLLVDNEGDLGVKTVDADGIVAFRRVRTLGQRGATVWVDGLPTTCHIIVVGAQFVAVGAKVETVDAGPMHAYRAS